MSEDKKSAQPVDPETRISTKLFDYLLREQGKTSSRDEDALTNPELEQLLGNLSKRLDEERVSDAALGTEAPMPVAVEDLAGAAGHGAVLGETPPRQTASEFVVTCHGCGSASTAAARFCATCGLDLHRELGAIKVTRNKPEAAATAQALLENKLQIEAAARRSSRPWKVACLALLCLVGILGIDVALQHPRQPSLLFEREASSISVSPTPASVVGLSPPKNEMRDTPRAIEQPLATTRSRHTPAEPPKSASSPSKGTSSTALSKLSSGRSAKGKLKSPYTAAQTSTPSAFPSSIDLRNAPVQGSVVMRVTIDTDGTVRRLRFVSGNPLLVDSAMEAVKKRQYRPYMLNGKAIEGETTITVNFERQ